MFEARKKYESKRFVLICKEKIKAKESYLPYPNMRPSTFNYGVKFTYDGDSKYSLAYDHYGDYYDLLTMEKLKKIGVCSEVGDIVVASSKEIFENDIREIVTCREVFDKYVEIYNSLIGEKPELTNLDNEELKVKQKNVAVLLKKIS